MHQPTAKSSKSDQSRSETRAQRCRYSLRRMDYGRWEERRWALINCYGIRDFTPFLYFKFIGGRSTM
ncbi:hypothetical protein TcasGA2_TC014654 [Tribolium castaneum]|uniref:Uncharacterized protein n=1 Tax=Tribolium castaneum TaxID=7070 RepID=D6WNE0_TRICA|nr:hypothetical protein TcasGA2_TC014654 [Tribolium castaneum]